VQLQSSNSAATVEQQCSYSRATVDCLFVNHELTDQMG
jgi:hypothetical protein